MGQLKSKLTRSDKKANAGSDPDEKWSNLYREREKNHLYKWVGVGSGENSSIMSLLICTFNSFLAY